MIHELKTLSEYFVPVYEQKKTFEVRNDDRGFSAGDWLYLREIDADMNYTGRSVFAYVPYVLDDDRYCLPGMVILSLTNLLYPRHLYSGDIDDIKREIESGEIWNTLIQNGALQL